LQYIFNCLNFAQFHSNRKFVLTRDFLFMIARTHTHTHTQAFSESVQHSE